jgi:hypothetical protein
MKDKPLIKWADDKLLISSLFMIASAVSALIYSFINPSYYGTIEFYIMTAVVLFFSGATLASASFQNEIYVRYFEARESETQELKEAVAYGRALRDKKRAKYEPWAE